MVGRDNARAHTASAGREKMAWTMPPGSARKPKVDTQPPDVMLTLQLNCEIVMNEPSEFDRNGSLQAVSPLAQMTVYDAYRGKFMMLILGI
jgi:hypothetical protein